MILLRFGYSEVEVQYFLATSGYTQVQVIERFPTSFSGCDYKDFFVGHFEGMNPQGNWVEGEVIRVN